MSEKANGEERDNGGRVYPYRSESVSQEWGISRRDWLAGLFAQGMVANPGFLAVLGQTAKKANLREDQITAKAAYELADAVIAESNK